MPLILSIWSPIILWFEYCLLSLTSLKTFSFLRPFFVLFNNSCNESFLVNKSAGSYRAGTFSAIMYFFIFFGGGLFSKFNSQNPFVSEWTDTASNDEDLLTFCPSKVFSNVKYLIFSNSCFLVSGSNFILLLVVLICFYIFWICINELVLRIDYVFSVNFVLKLNF